MPIVKFSVKDIKRLVQELESTDAFSPTTDHLFDPSMYPDGVVRDSHGRSEAQAEAQGGFFWPSKDYVDTSRVPASLMLVGDQGVYLITNADMDGTPASRDTAVYAEGCDPDKDAEFYDNKVAIFGGDDGAVTIPLGWAKRVIGLGQRKLKLKLTSNEVRLV